MHAYVLAVMFIRGLERRAWLYRDWRPDIVMHPGENAAEYEKVAGSESRRDHLPRDRPTFPGRMGGPGTASPASTATKIWQGSLKLSLVWELIQKIVDVANSRIDGMHNMPNGLLWDAIESLEY